jgi:septal ring factor EnvC (AmiA/AmiB activator)
MASRSSDRVSLRPFVLLATTIAVCGAGASAQAPDRAATEAQAARAAARLQALQRESDQLASEERTLLGELRKLEVERQIRAEELQQADATAKAADREVAAATERIEQLEQQDLAERPDLRARLVEIYKLGRGRYLRLLLSTPDLRRLGQASRAVAALAKLDRERVETHQRTLAALKATRDSLEAEQRRLAALRDAAARAADAAARAAAARAALIHDIDSRRDLNAQFAGELQAAQQKLQASLRQLAEGRPAEPSVLPIKPFRGDLDWPVAGAVRRRFAQPSASHGSAGASKGIEIAAVEGTPAAAVHDGIVAFADVFAGFGHLVILDHGSRTFSLYGNLLDVAVAKGAHVERGQTVGRIGPSPAGPAGLYFELRVDGQPVDPLQWLKKIR